MSVTLSRQEFLLMQSYIREHCGIQIDEDKAYLVETRLGKLVSESGAGSFLNFYLLLRRRPGRGEMARKVIDAITTRETQWFRDKNPWHIIEDIFLPTYVDQIRAGSRSRVRIWSAACATGQEPYSIAMCIDRFLEQRKIRDVTLDQFEILATDISPAALQIAERGRYDSISMSRGLDDFYRARYFRQEGQLWSLAEWLKKAVQFRQFNLAGSFATLRAFDIVFCRYVTIYFFEEFKQEVFDKMAGVLNSGGIMFLGSSELFAGHPGKFEQREHRGGVYYRVRRCV